MSTPVGSSKGLPDDTKAPEGAVQDVESQDSIDLQKEVWDASAVDPVLAKKMALVNDAIDEIGMTTFQWKLFFLNGFGYAVDSVNCNGGNIT